MDDDDDAPVDFNSFKPGGAKAKPVPVEEPEGDEPPEKAKTSAQIQADKPAADKEPPKPATPAEPITAEPAPVTAAPASQNVGGRDYTGFEPHEVSILKGTSKEAFEYVKARLTEKKQLAAEYNELKTRHGELEQNYKNIESKKLPESWYEHESAYQLDPVYQENVDLYDNANKAVAFWKDQLLRIKRSEDWTDVVGMDANGNPRYAQKPASVEAEMAVQDRINDAAGYQRQAIGNINSVKNSFKQKVSDGIAKITAIEHKYFPQWKDSTTLKDNQYYKDVDAALGSLNKTNPLASIMKKMYVYAAEMKMKLAKIESEKAQQNELANLQTKAGPGSADLNGGATTGKRVYADPDDEPVSLKPFEELKRKHGL